MRLLFASNPESIPQGVCPFEDGLLVFFWRPARSQIRQVNHAGTKPGKQTRCNCGHQTAPTDHMRFQSLRHSQQSSQRAGKQPYHGAIGWSLAFVLFEGICRAWHVLLIRNSLTILSVGNRTQSTVRSPGISSRDEAIQPSPREPIALRAISEHISSLYLGYAAMPANASPDSDLGPLRSSSNTSTVRMKPAGWINAELGISL